MWRSSRSIGAYFGVKGEALGTAVVLAREHERRGGRELPVAARFVGGVVEVPANATLVLARENDGSAERFTFHTEVRAD